MSGYVRTTTKPYHVESWGERGDVWWVMSSNSRNVATCYSERTARRIARLLNAEASYLGSNEADS